LRDLLQPQAAIAFSVRRCCTCPPNRRAR